MVSQAYNFLTKFLSSSIFLTENASDNVTARGNPSGTAITTTATPITKYLSNLVRLFGSKESSSLNMILQSHNMVRENTVIDAPISPNILISVASTSSLPYKGVPSSSSSSKASYALIFPAQESLPTTITTK